MRARTLSLLFAACAVLSGCAPSRLPHTDLEFAVLQNDTAKAEALVARGDDPAAPGPWSGTDAITWALLKKNTELARRMLQHCLEMYAPGKNCPLALTDAARLGDLELVKAFLAKGAEVGTQPLVYAGMNGSEEMAQLLVAGGADLDAAIERSDARGRAILMSLQEEHKTAARPQPAKPSAETASREDVRRMMDEAAKKLPQAQTAAPVSLSLVSDIDKPAYAKTPDPKNYALVVGIDEYAGLPNVQFAERDAKAVREHLVALGYPERNVVLLTGQKASRSGLVKNLETWLARNVDEKSTVFFYYAGYGTPDPKTGQPYLLPSDGDPQYLDDTAYPVKRLYEKLGALKARRVIVALDSSFSGAGGRSVLAKGIKPLVTKVDMGSDSSGKIVSLSASASDQAAGVATEQQHGLFTYYFLRGLNGAAGNSDGGVTVKNLYDYLSPKVQDQARQDNREQTPQLLPGSSDGADLRLR